MEEASPLQGGQLETVGVLQAEDMVTEDENRAGQFTQQSWPQGALHRLNLLLLEHGNQTPPFSKVNIKRFHILCLMSSLIPRWTSQKVPLLVSVSVIKALRSRVMVLNISKGTLQLHFTNNA